MDAASPETIPWDPQNLLQPGLRDCACHTSSTDRQIIPNDTDKYQDFLLVSLSQQAGIQHVVLAGKHDRGWRSTGEVVPSHLLPTPGLGRRVDTLLRAKFCDLRGCHQCKIYPNHLWIPPALHIGALTGIGGVPDTLPVPRSHSFRLHQHQHCPIPELAWPSGRWSSDGVWSYGPPLPLLADLVVQAHEDVV